MLQSLWGRILFAAVILSSLPSLRADMLISDDFSGTPNPTNTAAPATGVWYLPTGGYGEDQNFSVNTVPLATGDGSTWLQLGYGYDAVSIRHFLPDTWNRDAVYTVSFDWGLKTILDLEGGFQVLLRSVDASGGGLAEVYNESIISPDRTVGATGHVSFTVGAADIEAAGAHGQQIGLWFFKGGGYTPNRVDVYVVDNVSLTFEAVSEPFALRLLGMHAAESGSALEVQWTSRTGMVYNLLSNESLGGTPDTWTTVTNDIAATPPANTLALPIPTAARTFFAVEELAAAPLFSENPDSGQGAAMTDSDGP